MRPCCFPLLPLLSAGIAHALPQQPPPVDPEATLKTSVAAAVSSAALKPYVTPLASTEILEVGAYGDSFTAGIGSNGPGDRDGYSQRCSRYGKGMLNPSFAGSGHHC